jgi:hypothetical protein
MSSAIRTPVGIPYAMREMRGRNTFAICPICKASILLTEQKDWESHTGDEYATHYAAEHAGTETTAPAAKKVAPKKKTALKKKAKP